MSVLSALDPKRLFALVTLSLAVGCSSAAVGTPADEPAPTAFGERAKTTMEAPLAEEPAPATSEVNEGTNVPASPETSAPPAIPMPYRGVNLAGGEFGNVLPGLEGIDYRWPTNANVDYYVSKGMNTFRIGFKWERVQPKAYGDLDAKYVAKLDALVTYATAKGANVILNPHNFARYYGDVVGTTKVPSAAFADLWRRLALRHGPNSRVMFNLVNEPNNLPTEQWVDAANAAIAAIRDTGATNKIIVPGNGWTGAYSWAHDYYGTPNAKAMLDIVDPKDNVVFEVHQYLDANSSGGSTECVSATIGRERLAPFVAWLRKHGKKGFVGEFAGGDNTMCNAAVTDMLSSMMEASDVLEGWLWWAAGPAWGNSYPFSLDPRNGVDRPQMSLLVPYLAATAATL
ncbi:MAG TPA: glycoside hydrolase family 5 protein [Labilithrix sp.]|nr:glycoside hydrolase family 5 protein [Labilithrix sp.]